MNASPAIQAIVIGATGYVGGELLRLIAGHPDMQLHAAVSTSSHEAIRTLYPNLAKAFPEQSFVAPDNASKGLDSNSRVALFSAAPHGKSAAIVAALLESIEASGANVRIVDVSADFRYPDAAAFEAVYGIAHSTPQLMGQFSCAVPEHAADMNGMHVGHPGCFATALLLASVPLVAAGFATERLFATGVTGSTGSGRAASAGTHHPERHANLYAYKALEHRHVPEVEGGILAATGSAVGVSFIPHSGPFARGIYVTVQAQLRQATPKADIVSAFVEYYEQSPFVRVVDGTPRLKDVVVSNDCHVGVAVNDQTVCITAAIDNLVKGAAGGAVQWMNRLWSLPEEHGLATPAACWI